jgi:hypothetical protein
MANALFTPAREGLLDGTVDVVNGVIKVALVRGYTYSASHKFVSDVTGAGGTIAATSGAIANKTETAGAFDGDDVTFSAVASNASAHGLLVFQSSAATGGADVSASAQRVLLWLDTGTNLPISPNGGDIVVAWDSGSNRIFHV